MGGQVSTEQRSKLGTVNSVHSLDSYIKRFHQSFLPSLPFNKLMVIEFSAYGCGPCKFIEPAVHDLAIEFSDVDFIKIDVDELPNRAKHFDVQATPTFVLFNKGKELDRTIGVKKDELHRMIEKHRV
ncbi:thioredoxin H2-like [Rutidosis leptorrhynchoides]|uniref:thioredoxin H2-like n=1 Tax=Rutidosis leptorrhynchoides TaxID=125765 RepID=UPI003A99C578